MQGSVAEFDARRGVGTIVADGRRYFFHCTRLADGSREVAVGQPVEFTVGPGRMGDWEAVAVTKMR
jgi:cold shock CspA family protein